MTDNPPRRETNRMSGSMRVLLLTLAVAVAALLVHLIVADWEPLPDTTNLHWWLLVPAVYLSEITVVHFRGRRDAHSFSMSEIPLIFGLYFFAPGEMMLAVLIGSALVLSIHRRQPLLKLLFNVSQFTLVFGVAAIVFRLIIRLGDPLGPAGWAGGLLGALVSLIVAMGLVNLAIFLVSGSFRRPGLAEVVWLSTLATMMSASLALIAVTMAKLAPGMALLSLIPPAVLFLSYRAYMGQREQRTRLESLYEATRVLHETPEIEEAMLVAAERARAMFQAEYAEITLFSGDTHEAAYRTRVGPADDRLAMTLINLDHERSIWHPIAEAQTTHMFAKSEPEIIRPVGCPPIREGIATPLFVDDAVGGVLLVANKLDDVSKYKQRDSRLLETFARQVAVSLENGKLVDSLASLTELKEELKHQALHDSLTGLANRANFSLKVTEALDAITPDASVAVMFLDLDDFKSVNDSLGHAAGDQLLIEVAARLQAVCRADDEVARIGGDEFAVLVPVARDEAGVEALATRMVESLNMPFAIEDRQVVTRASIGVAFARPDDGPRELLSNADAAMYAAKHQGKGTYRTFEESMHEAVSKTLELRAALQSALRLDQLDLHYQPIVDIHSGVIASFEALMRWNHPERGVIQPNEFIPYTEESGLIVTLGEWALTKACGDAQRWQAAHPESTVGVTVNLSPKQLQEANIVDRVRSVLSETGLDPDRLTLEVTENVVMHTAVHRLEQLKALGIHLAIDDFGTGYSSLSYLDRLPIDIVKIDRSFVERLGHGETSLVRTVLTIGNSLELGSIIEGVETRDQLMRLRQLGCRHVQGFYLSPPVPIDQAIDLVPHLLLDPSAPGATVTRLRTG
ncbi:MAG: EAL domain-containing protein [Acidimicrobiia bacterium]|nr:EAL domain-containing protein [Acidimicrobiia bacterium]